jgi:hypothetical protein
MDSRVQSSGMVWSSMHQTHQSLEAETSRRVPVRLSLGTVDIICSSLFRCHYTSKSHGTDFGLCAMLPQQLDRVRRFCQEEGVMCYAEKNTLHVSDVIVTHDLPKVCQRS